MVGSPAAAKKQPLVLVRLGIQIICLLGLGFFFIFYFCFHFVPMVWEILMKRVRDY